MQNQEWFAAKKGIECLHIKFMLAKDVFESRMTQMKEGENNEDITKMDNTLSSGL
jgi:hypothetical protein